MAWMLAAGGGCASPSGYDFARQENVEALSWVRSRLVEPGLAGRRPRTVQPYPCLRGLPQGRGRDDDRTSRPDQGRRSRRAPYGHAAFPRRSGGAAPPLGLSDWLMAFRRNGHRAECGAFLNFLYSEQMATRFAAGQGTLPVTVSGAESLRARSSQRPLWEFLDQMPKAEFPPVGRSSWPTVRDALRKRIGQAVTRGRQPPACARHPAGDGERRGGHGTTARPDAAPGAYAPVAQVICRRTSSWRCPVGVGEQRRRAGPARRPGRPTSRSPGRRP